jgi:hypothetical protein
MKLILLLATVVNSLAPLEQPDGSPIHFGAWYDRLNGDTPAKMIERVGSKPFSFFQSDMNITETMDDEQMGYINQFVEQVEATNSDAFIYLTLYPFFGFERVTDKAIDQFAQRVKKIVDSGRKILIRYASEMNGSWFSYGQQPTTFKKSWIAMVTHVREVTKDHADSVAFLWAPNSGMGYPFKNNLFSVSMNATENIGKKEIEGRTFDMDLDTNQDGLYDDKDDPFSPYFPGDDYVDWVGFSLYHYGNKWEHDETEYGNGWHTNDVPALSKAENYITGKNDPIIGDLDGFRNNFNFYEMFCGSGAGGMYRGKNVALSKGDHPFFITETAATIFIAFSVPIANTTDPVQHEFITLPNDDAESRVKIRRAWYSQMLNETFLQALPKIKGFAFFEFIKHEEGSFRDFTALGNGGSMQSDYGSDTDMDGPSLAAFKDDLGTFDHLIQWANIKILKEAPEPMWYTNVLLYVGVGCVVVLIGAVWFLRKRKQVFKSDKMKSTPMDLRNSNLPVWSREAVDKEMPSAAPVDVNDTYHTIDVEDTMEYSNANDQSQMDIDPDHNYQHNRTTILEFLNATADTLLRNNTLPAMEDSQVQIEPENTTTATDLILNSTLILTIPAAPFDNPKLEVEEMIATILVEESEFTNDPMPAQEEIVDLIENIANESEVVPVEEVVETSTTKVNNDSIPAETSVEESELMNDPMPAQEEIVVLIENIVNESEVVPVEEVVETSTILADEPEVNNDVDKEVAEEISSAIVVENIANGHENVDVEQMNVSSINIAEEQVKIDPTPEEDVVKSFADLVEGAFNMNSEPILIERYVEVVPEVPSGTINANQEGPPAGVLAEELGNEELK